jgi:hypothetical protein
MRLRGECPVLDMIAWYELISMRERNTVDPG